MRHVVERCPSCGVEHDEAVGGACEACGTPLRAWCRRHGREAGWLEGPACPRCAEESARPRAAPAARTVCYAPAPDRPSAAPPARAAAPIDEAAEHVPPRRPGIVSEAVGILLLLVVNATIGALAGLVGGGLYTVVGGGNGSQAAVEWAMMGGIVGLIIGVMRDVLSLNAAGRGSRR